MAPCPHTRYPRDWIAYDEDNDAVVIMFTNLFDHPTDPDGEPFCYPIWSRLVYAGDGLFSSEEDMYNPNRAIGAWIEVNGQHATDEIQQSNA